MNKKHIVIICSLILLVIITLLLFRGDTPTKSPRKEHTKELIQKEVTKKSTTTEERAEEAKTASFKAYETIDKDFIKEHFDQEILPFISENKYSIATSLRACPTSQYDANFGERVMEYGGVTYYKKTLSREDLLNVNENNFPVLINRQNDGLAYLTGGVTIQIMQGESIDEITNNYPLQLKYHLKGTQTYYLNCGQCNIQEVTKALAQSEIVLEVTTEVVQFQDESR